MDFTAQDHCESLYDLIYVVDRHMPHDVQYSGLIAALEPLVDVFREANEEKDIEAAFTGTVQLDRLAIRALTILLDQHFMVA